MNALDPAQDARRALENIGRRLRCIPRMLTIQNARLGSPLDSDEINDVTQDALVIIWRKLAEYQAATSFESWGYRICFLELMNHVRKKRRRARLLSEAAARRAEEEAADRSQGTARFVDIHAGLGTLALDEADVVRMHHFDDQSFPEISECLGIPLGTVKTRYYRGLQKLREFLLNRGEEARRERTHA